MIFAEHSSALNNFKVTKKTVMTWSRSTYRDRDFQADIRISIS